MTKKEQIIDACEKVVTGLEDNSISGYSALLLCKKIARLSNDTEAYCWLDLELSGYPHTEDGKHIESVAFKIGWDHKRGYFYEDKKCIFTELISQLDESIENNKKSLSCFSTNGASVSGEHAFSAMNKLVSGVQGSIASLNKNIQQYERYKSILINEYYSYAHKKQIEILFGDYTESIFTEYQNNLNKYFNSIGTDTLLKLNAIQEAMKNDNKECYSQALTTCRKMFLDVSCDLFNKVFPGYENKTYRTRSGVEIDISGEHSVNKLSAVIESLEQKSSKKTITGSNIVYFVDFLETVIAEQSKGVHHEISKSEANSCIIQTYIALGSVISLFIESAKED